MADQSTVETVPVYGIAGKVCRNKDIEVDEAVVRGMLGCFSPEIPKGARFHTRAYLGFGCRTFSHPAAPPPDQPVCNGDGSVVLVLHGRVFNAPDLKKQLAASGHAFVSGSEAEIVLRGYEEWGKGVAVKMRGVYVFAVCDARLGALHLVRDRIGMKPLFYAHLRPGAPDEALLFASEVKSFLADPAFVKRVDIMALNHYLAFQYVPHPRSIFEGARKLPPAHWLTYQDGNIEARRYWQLEYEPKRPIGDDEAVEESLALIDEAVRARLAAGGKIGCHLSGGVDSSTIVAIARRHVTGDLKTFSIGFREQEFNELPYARQVARQFATDHHEFIVRPNALECLGDLAWYFDEPMADSSGIATYYLCKLTREHVDVALNGDGGDESFAGYARYLGFRAFNRYRMIPRPLRAMADAPFAALARAFPGIAKAELLSYVNHATLMGDARLYTQTMVIFRGYQRRAILAPHHRGILSLPESDSEQMTVDLMNLVPGRAWIDRMTFSDISLYLPGALIPKVERMLSASCLEGHAPLLDQSIMEFAARLPAAVRFKNNTLKPVLKKAAATFFTGEFLNRPKTGFGVPIGEWVRGELRPLAEEFLLGDRARSRGFFDYDYVRRMLDQHIRGSQNHHYRIWELIMLETWCRTFLDRPNPLAGPIRLN
ncbi:MAG: asparagine synthase (glutamine-hydrolyzing) [Candidatus Sumerlaeota bacterium]|nr:asparagine synthase (glutamine-hydrolyzing) [Candidatus Sumerlaeota bacterium]